MKLNFTLDILKKLEEVREKYLTEHDSEKKKYILSNISKELSINYDDNIATNVINIMNHYLVEEDAELDDLIEFLKSNDGLDIQTRKREEEEAFDKRFGTTTSTILAQYELPEKVSLSRFRNSGRYHPSPISSVFMALKALEEYGVKYSDFIFIDIGSGMGRNLLLASDFPFKKIVGLEHSTYLHNIAMGNVYKYTSNNNNKTRIFDLQSIDVLNYDFPKENMVLYFWRPFSDEIASQFIRKLEDFIHTSALRIILIFLGHVYPVVEKSSSFHMLDKFSTPDFSFSEKSYFTITIYSNIRL